MMKLYFKILIKNSGSLIKWTITIKSKLKKITISFPYKECSIIMTIIDII